jgi:hypothetical protein
MTSPIINIFPEASKLQTLVAEIPHGTKLEDILDPGYWANVSKKLVAHKTHIKANWEDGTRLVELRVVGVGLNSAKVRVLQDYDFTAPVSTVVSAPDTTLSAQPVAGVLRERDYEVAYKGSIHKWSVIRLTGADKAYVKDQFDSKDEASEWLKKYVAGEVTVKEAA